MRNSRLLWFLGIVCILAGISFLILGFFLAETTSRYHHTFLAYLTTNFGGLLIFTASYTLISEGYLRRRFAREMTEMMKDIIRLAQVNQSIAETGLSEIGQFTPEVLHERVKRAQTVKMIFVKNTAYLRGYCESIRERIADGRLNLDIMIPDPSDGVLMGVIERRYDEYEDHGRLSNSILHCVNTWIRTKIFNELPENCRDHLHVYLTRQSSLYSAYLFDRDELWYIPYNCRAGRHLLPVFVFRNLEEQCQIYRDVVELFRFARKVDLSVRLNLETNDSPSSLFPSS